MRFGASILLFAGLATLNAATLERMSVDEMAQQSTAVVRGRVGDAQTTRIGALVYTLYGFEIEEQWKGSPSPGLEVAVLGGTYQGLTYTFAGTPELKYGDEYILFLWTGPSGRTQIVGLSQGVFRVVRHPGGAAVAQAEAEESKFVGEGGTQRPQALQMPLDRFAASVHAALETYSK